MRAIFTTRIFLSVLFFCTCQQAFTQTKEEMEYRKESDKTRNEVWGWDKPEFKNRQVPAEYATVSKVVIAHHTELSADSKSKFAVTGLGFGSKKESSITEIVREMVKVNDKSSVDEYSEMNFTRFIKRSGFLTKAKSTTFIGVRVIKPNQTIREINADDIVLTQDESTVKKAKLAIPDLQPGDIIDYFIATDQVLTNDFSDKFYNVILFDEAPVLHYSFHGQLGKKFAIDYRSYNGAPDLKVAKNDDNDIIIDVEKKNMPAFETSLWVAPALQLPLIRMSISLGYKGPGRKFLGISKPGEVNKNKSSDEIIEMQSRSLATEFYNAFYARGGYSEFAQIVTAAKKMAKQSGLDFKEMSDEDKAAHLFYTFRFSKLLNFDIERLQRSIQSGDYTYDGLAFLLNCTFKAAELQPAILVSSPRTGFRMNEVMGLDDLTNTAFLMGTNKLFSIQSVYDIPFAAPESIEGAKTTSSVKLNSSKMIMSTSAMFKLAEAGPGIKVPESTAGKNGHIEQLIMSLNPDNSSLAVQRKSIIKGHYKYDQQRQLILYEDYYEAERKAMGEEKSLLEELEDGKKSRKYVDEVRNAFAEARKKQKDAFISEAKGWFEQEVSDLKNFKIDNLGVRHTSPDFIYSSSFNLEGLVKNAGNNLILEIGKIQGQPLSIKPEQRKRDIDIYMPYARSIEYQIELKIPEGYSAEGVEALNKNVSNETGLFITEATTTGDLVRIKVRKQYLNSYEPVGNWEKMIQFIDASNDWTNAKLLFKKK